MLFIFRLINLTLDLWVLNLEWLTHALNSSLYSVPFGYLTNRCQFIYISLSQPKRKLNFQTENITLHVEIFMTLISEIENFSYVQLKQYNPNKDTD